MKHTDLINSFVAENPFSFSEEELSIVASWKHSICDTFYLLRYYKDYAVFLTSKEPTVAYGVLALYDPFEYIVCSSPPVMIRTVILPFKDKIVYDGLVQPYPIVFGGGVREGMNRAYQEAKAKFGIVTTMPFSGKEQEHSDEERLKVYIKSGERVGDDLDNIDNLISKNPLLIPIYHQEIGSINSRKIKKRLTEQGIINTWFAVLDEDVVASGNSMEQVRATLKSVLPEGKQDWAHIFKIK